MLKSYAVLRGITVFQCCWLVTLVYCINTVKPPNNIELWKGCKWWLTERLSKDGSSLQKFYDKCILAFNANTVWMVIFCYKFYIERFEVKNLGRVFWIKGNLIYSNKKNGTRRVTNEWGSEDTTSGGTIYLQCLLSFVYLTEGTWYS